MTKKGIFKYLMLTVFFGCMLIGIGTVSVNAVSSGKTQISCFDSRSWRNTVISTPDSGAVRITRVSCSSNLADETAYVQHSGGTTSKSTTEKNRTVEAKVTLLVDVIHKHYYSAYYG